MRFPPPSITLCIQNKHIFRTIFVQNLIYRSHATDAYPTVEDLSALATDHSDYYLPFRFTDKIDRIHDIIHNYGLKNASDLDQVSKKVTIGGRISSIRQMGARLAFIDVHSNGNHIQVILSSDSIESFNIKRSDIIKCTGILARSKSGELSVRATQVNVLAPCVVPIPEKTAPPMKTDLRIRNRHLDLITDELSIQRFKMRSEVLKVIRKFLDERDFTEVETPVLTSHGVGGGGTAEPFVTNESNAINCQLQLRISPELFLKKLIIGGIDRVYEIGKVFRNEGHDNTHHAEFTMLELYESFSSVDHMKIYSKQIIGSLLQKFGGSRRFHGYEPGQSIQEVDIMSELRHITQKTLNLNDLSECYSEVCQLMDHYNIQVDGDKSLPHLLDKLIGHLIEPRCLQPTFLINHPLIMSPLACKNELDPTLSSRFELFIDRVEIANGYDELSDPFEQRNRFIGFNSSSYLSPKLYVAGDDRNDLDRINAQRALKFSREAPVSFGSESILCAESKVDETFLEALMAGMPPTAGCGIGIDRLVMLLTDSESIRDTILFPLVKNR